MILARVNFVYVYAYCKGRVRITFSDSSRIDILAKYEQVWPRIMEHSQLSATLGIFCGGLIFLSYFLVMWEVFERSSGTFWRKSRSEEAHFCPPLWEKIHSDSQITDTVIIKSWLLANKCQLAIDTSSLNAFKGKDFCGILLPDRCPCGLGPRRQWNGISESREIRGSAWQWDSNKIWSFHETSEAESLHTVCAGPWQCSCGFNKVVDQSTKRKLSSPSIFLLGFSKDFTALDTQCFF